MLSTIAWRINGELTYALEGSVFVAGALIQWLRDKLGIIKEAPEVENLANTVEDNGGITFIPALSGLTAPYWDPYAQGTIFGITRGTENGHIARAALESIALRTRDIIIEMQRCKYKIYKLKVDGGASNNNLLMQIQSDLLQTNVVRPKTTETTALGVAFLAGLATGFWKNVSDLNDLWIEDKSFNPNLKNDSKHIINLWRSELKNFLGLMNRNDSIIKLNKVLEWDIVIIGGGASGLGIAVDASKRGYKTLLWKNMTMEKVLHQEVQNLFMEGLGIYKMVILP